MDKCDVPLKLLHIKKSFKSKTILRDVNLEIKQTEPMYILAGPNGAGKTTLLKIIAGLLQPDSGEVYINCENATYLPAWKRKIGFLQSPPQLIPTLNVKGNLEIPLILRKISDREKILDEIVEKTGIIDLLSKYPGQLSSGERQRVALAQILVASPQIILLDEPLVHLDRRSKNEIRELIKMIAFKEKIPVIMVTHSIVDISMFERARTGFLINGEIIEEGRGKEILLRPADQKIISFMDLFPENLEDMENATRIFGELITKNMRTCSKKPKKVWIPPNSIVFSKNNAIKGEIIDVEFQPPITKYTIKVNGIELVAVSSTREIIEDRFVGVEILSQGLVFYDESGKRIC